VESPNLLAVTLHDQPKAGMLDLISQSGPVGTLALRVGIFEDAERAKRGICRNDIRASGFDQKKQDKRHAGHQVPERTNGTGKTAGRGHDQSRRPRDQLRATADDYQRQIDAATAQPEMQQSRSNDQGADETAPSDETGTKSPREDPEMG
jgi:hypothetical protein